MLTSCTKAEGRNTNESLQVCIPHSIEPCRSQRFHQRLCDGSTECHVLTNLSKNSDTSKLWWQPAYDGVIYGARTTYAVNGGYSGLYCTKNREEEKDRGNLSVCLFPITLNEAYEICHHYLTI